MIKTVDDYTDDILKLYPGIKKRSVEKIIKTGLTNIRRELVRGEEILLNNSRIKFFIPDTPEKQQHRTHKNRLKRERRKYNEEANL